MHPDREIVRTYRRSYGLSTVPDDHNTLTHQSADTNDAPKEPLSSAPLQRVTLNSFTVHLEKAYKIMVDYREYSYKSKEVFNDIETGVYFSLRNYYNANLKHVHLSCKIVDTIKNRTRDNVLGHILSKNVIPDMKSLSKDWRTNMQGLK